MNTEEIKNKYFNTEEILWEGQPKNPPLFNKYDFLMIPFTLLFGGLCLFYAAITILMMIAGQSIMFSFVGITFLLVGVYLLFLRLWYDLHTL